MAARMDRHLEGMAERGEADQRNGSYGRWLMTELGEIEVRVPNHYPVLMPDGVVLSRKTGLGGLRRPVLVALGSIRTVARGSWTTA